jgi:hypothetical protein
MGIPMLLTYRSYGAEICKCFKKSRLTSRFSALFLHPSANPSSNLNTQYSRLPKPFYNSPTDLYKYHNSNFNYKLLNIKIPNLLEL